MIRKYIGFLVLLLLVCATASAHHDENVYKENGSGVLEYQSQNQEKHKRDYQMRRDSIDALLSQYQNIGIEKDLVQDAENLKQDVLVLTRLGEYEASLQHFAKARSIIDPAYRLIKQAIIAARNGEELIMSLNFATPKDEYDYYLQKIDSQRRAIGIFMPQIASERARKTIARILNEANAEYDRAQSLVSKADYAQALPLMDRVLNKLRSGLMMVVNQ